MGGTVEDAVRRGPAVRRLRLAVLAATVATLFAVTFGPAAAQQPEVVTLTADGPATGHLGDTVWYRLDYTIEGGPGVDVRLDWTPGKAVYVSTTVVTGEVLGCFEGHVGGTIGYVRCSLPAGSGTLEVALQIQLDVTGGVLTFGADEPGTPVPGLRPLAFSNRVATLITPVAAPATGSGSLGSGGRAAPVSPGALLLAAGITGLAAAVWVAAAKRAK